MAREFYLSPVGFREGLPARAHMPIPICFIRFQNIDSSLVRLISVCDFEDFVVEYST